MDGIQRAVSTAETAPAPAPTDRRTACVTVSTSVFTSAMTTPVAPPPAADAEGPRCFVCLDPAKRNNGLCATTGCACRGESAGLLHFACAVGEAQANWKSWHECLTCKQDFTRALYLRLAREWC